MLVNNLNNNKTVISNSGISRVVANIQDHIPLNFGAVLIFCLAVLLAACGQTPGPRRTTDTATPNPYLTHKITVARQAQTLFSQALKKMQAKQWRDAERLLQQVTTDYPHLSGPWLNLGIVYRLTQRLPAAQKAFQRAIEANRYNLDAYNQLAVLKREQGDFAAAEALYLKALSVWPQHSDSHRNAGILYDLYLGQLEKALLHFQTYQALQQEPDKQVKGWIIDLRRRIQNVAKVEVNS